jgi:hypothetical protein
MTTIGSMPGQSTPEEKIPSKIARILRYLLAGGSLNRFDAEHHHDHCLHTTVSTLENEHGVHIDRQTEKVPCVYGRKTTRVKRYWLDFTNVENIKWARLTLNKLDPA